MIDILFPAFVISIVLLGIHSYFGLRIIERNIIFTDLAIGQMAAMGAAVSLLLLGGSFMYLTSLAFALLTAVLISFLSKRSAYLEAIIGLFYALGIAGVFILLSKSAHGMEEFQNLMAYDILFTKMSAVYRTALIYLGIGGFVLFIEKKTTGTLKEVLFFVTFAATVTSSVKMAGVLVVFSILLSPAFIAIQLASLKKTPAVIKNNRLIFAWFIGTLINIVAIIASSYGDFPTGYSIVFANAFFAIVTALFIKKGRDNEAGIAERPNNTVN